MNKTSFDELNLSSEMQKAVSDMGFEFMSPIQEEAIPVVMDGLDIIGQAQTGTGKTAAFGIPLLEMTNVKDKAVQTIVLCPTRELCIQVADEIERLAKYKRGISVLPIYGGQPIDRQINRLKKGVQVVVGTPGRVIDHIRRRTLKLGGASMVVLDEADEMFDMGFRDDIELILNETPKERQTVFFSATMPKEIIRFTNKYQKNPKLIKVVKKELTASMVEQNYYSVKANMKTEALCRLMELHEPKLSVIFCNTKRKVDDLTAELQTRGYLVDGLHGDLRQPQRDKVMNKFRRGNIQILVATDVAARGIDVDDVDIVFNYDVPQDEEYYVHRIGRTGRAGREGLALSLVSGRDIGQLRKIERYTKTKVARKELPTVKDVKAKRMDGFTTDLKNIMEKSDLSKYQKTIDKLESEGHDLKDIASSLLKIYMDEVKMDEFKEGDLSDSNQRSRRDNKNRQGGGKASGDMTRIFINTGRRQGVAARHILGAIMGEVSMPKEAVGTIDIFDRFTFVDVSDNYAQKLVNDLNNKRIKGSPVNVEFANTNKK